MAVVTVERKILKKNDEIANENRELLKQNNVYALNLLSSPGSGKTTLLEKTLSKINKSADFSGKGGNTETQVIAHNERQKDGTGVPDIPNLIDKLK